MSSMLFVFFRFPAQNFMRTKRLIIQNYHTNSTHYFHACLGFVEYNNEELHLKGTFIFHN